HPSASVSEALLRVSASDNFGVPQAAAPEERWPWQIHGRES
ncbi:unnamed protein product, partial [Urochloa humidicola]